MPKQETFIRLFADQDKAFAYMVQKNRAHVNDIFALTYGPDDNFAVVDHLTAIELGQKYIISTSLLRQPTL